MVNTTFYVFFLVTQPICLYKINNAIFLDILKDSEG